jgi:hypothetical protein
MLLTRYSLSRGVKDDGEGGYYEVGALGVFVASLAKERRSKRLVIATDFLSGERGFECLTKIASLAIAWSSMTGGTTSKSATIVAETLAADVSAASATDATLVLAASANDVVAAYVSAAANVRDARIAAPPSSQSARTATIALAVALASLAASAIGLIAAKIGVATAASVAIAAGVRAKTRTTSKSNLTQSAVARRIFTPPRLLR